MRIRYRENADFMGHCEERSNLINKRQMTCGCFVPSNDVDYVSKCIMKTNALALIGVEILLCPPRRTQKIGADSRK